MKRKTGLLLFTVSVTMTVLLLLSSFFNVQSFWNSYVKTAAANNAIVAEGITSQLEYELKYGKTLDNYYGIASVFEELYGYCEYLGQAYIADASGRLIYRRQWDGMRQDAELPGNLEKYLEETADKKDAVSWTDGSTQHLLLPIKNQERELTAVLGMTYDTGALGGEISSYGKRIYGVSMAAAVCGILFFLLLFFMSGKKEDTRSLSRMLIPAILISNGIFSVCSYGIFQQGYLAITRNTADILESKIEYDIHKVVSQGVPYEELYGIDGYFDEILERTGQIDSIRLEVSESGSEADRSSGVYELTADEQGNPARLVMVLSSEYITDRLKELLINVAVWVVTSLMIGAEVVLFLLAVITGKKKKGKTMKKDKGSSIESLGIVRGLSFSFSCFQYMAMAFVPLVLSSIYRPVTVFKREIPYDIVMGLPLSIQILTSILTAWLSGRLIGRHGWKPVAVAGILIMSSGTMIAACAEEPCLFLFSQVVTGMGLGLSKTAFDLYGVLAASDEEMELYTSNANGGINVGLSCSSAIGAVIAGAFGFSGAYLTMTVIGGGVAVLVILLGQNIVESDAATQKLKEEKQVRIRFDLRFFAYLIFMVLPYFFVMMFVDYFFPVYANARGITTETIGYVFLVYGILTSYLGVWLCNFLARYVSGDLVMGGILCLNGGGILIFSVKNILVFSILLVLLIAVADGIMPSQQFKYVYGLPFSRKAGFTKAVSIEGIFSGSVRGIAPILFGYVMMKGNQGLLVVAVLIILSAMVFILLSRFGGRKEGESNAEV